MRASTHAVCCIWGTAPEVDAGFVELVPVDDSLRSQWPSMPSWRQLPALTLVQLFGGQANPK